MLTALEENVFLNIFLAVVIIAMYGVYDNITWRQPKAAHFAANFTNITVILALSFLFSKVAALLAYFSEEVFLFFHLLVRSYVVNFENMAYRYTTPSLCTTKASLS